jgi:hypothetical protein
MSQTELLANSKRAELTKERVRVEFESSFEPNQFLSSRVKQIGSTRLIFNPSFGRWSGSSVSGLD